MAKKTVLERANARPYVQPRDSTDELCREGFGSFMMQVIAERERLLKALRSIAKNAGKATPQIVARNALKEAGER